MMVLMLRRFVSALYPAVEQFRYEFADIHQTVALKLVRHVIPLRDSFIVK